MKKAAILIVEDEFLVAATIKTFLERSGYEVLSIMASGEDALVIAERDRPDLVLMDIHLKGRMDGIEAADYIRNKLNIAVIFLTGYYDEETLKRANIKEDFEFLRKPCEDWQILKAIGQALYKNTNSE